MTRGGKWHAAKPRWRPEPKPCDACGHARRDHGTAPAIRCGSCDCKAYRHTYGQRRPPP